MKLRQKTLKKIVIFEGEALFSGTKVLVEVSPAPSDHGIIFKRMDQLHEPEIPATIDHVSNEFRCTKISLRSGNEGEESDSVRLIEHFMAAVRALEIDNLLVKISGPEMPIFDGSALPFFNFLNKAGVVDQSGVKSIFYLEQPLYWSDQDLSFVALPSNHYQISYVLDYPTSPYLGCQYYSCTLDNFEKDLAPSRTFILYEEFLKMPFPSSANLSQGVVIHGDRVLNPEGIRFPNEMVKHKILDIVGDFSLIGNPFEAHLIAIKTGHKVNHKMARELKKNLKCK